jgi:uncharacterized surface protein with fasciclin (FAS1) repeats
MIKKMMAGVLLAALAVTAIAPATVSAKGSSLNIVEKAVAVNDKTGLFDTLLAAATCTPGIVDALSTSDDITLFAPTDRAFRKLGRDVGVGRLNAHNVCDKLPEAQRAAVLTYHVLGDEVKYRQALKLATRKGTEITMLSGEPAELVRRGWFRLFVDGTNSQPSRVVLPNVDASNGVIHVINRVLLP